MINRLLNDPRSFQCKRIAFLALFVASHCALLGCQSFWQKGTQPSQAVVLWGRSGDVGLLELLSSDSGSLDQEQLTGIASSMTDITRRNSGYLQVCVIGEPRPFRWSSIVSFFKVSNEKIVKTNEIEISPPVNFARANDYGFFVTQRNKVSEVDVSTQSIREIGSIAEDVMLVPFLADEGNVYCTGWYPPADKGEKYYLYSFSRHGKLTQNLGVISKQKLNEQQQSVDVTLQDGTVISLSLPKAPEVELDLIRPDYSLSSKPTTTFFSYGTLREARRAMYPLGIVVIPAEGVSASTKP